MAQKHTQGVGAMEKSMDSSNVTFKHGATERKDGKGCDESVDIFESIKLDEGFDEEEYRRRTRRRLIIISASCAILSLLIVGATVGIMVPRQLEKDNSFSLDLEERDAIKSICNSTLYPDSCYSSISSMKMSTADHNSSTSQHDTPMEIFMLSLQVTHHELVKLKSLTSASIKANDITTNALNICNRLISDAIDHVDMSISSLEQHTIDRDDLRTWLSTAITDQETCLDAITEFESISKPIQGILKASMKNSTMYTSNSLAIITKLTSINTHNRKALQSTETSLTGSWIHRRLAEVNRGAPTPNLTVAKDGSGDYMSIQEAVSAMPKRSKHRFYIYVKEGEYDENVEVDSDSWNLMIYGDGMNKSVVVQSLNYADGVATFNSGTFIVEGRGLIAKDIGFKNRAGPRKPRAVALRSSSDKSIFHGCSFEGYQDTLYTHTNRQFFQECSIIGTIDFIFGNAAAVFHNCTIQPREPGPEQYNTVTAQSKSDPNQNTGISIQQCSISPVGNVTTRTFLGRPWNDYSTTVIMETYIDGVVDPAGWAPWRPDSEPADTIFYAEYKNTGPGSGLDGRVTWAGYRPNITEEEAGKFSAEQFIQGNKWLGGYYRV